MHAHRILLWGLLISTAPALADAPSRRHRYSAHVEKAGELVTWPLSDAEKQLWNEFNIDWAQAKIMLDDRQQSHENQYYAASIYVESLVDFSEYDAARYYCQKYPPRPDHYEYISLCTRMSKKSVEEIAKELETTAEIAHEALPNRLTASSIYSTLGKFLSDKGRSHSAIAAYRKALAVTPADQEEFIIQIKLSLAIVYANPLLNKALQQNALSYYGEVRDWYAKQNPEPGNHAFIQMKAAIYNLGVAYLLNFQNYEAALQEFAAAMDFEWIEADAKVFSAYALAKSNQKDLALKTLNSIVWDKSIDPSRTAFLKCYAELTERILGLSTVLNACFKLDNPQPDVLLDLAQTIAGLKLSRAEENKNLRMFYQYFAEHLKPDIQESLGSAITTADLEREKAESRLKSLQLKNMSLYQNLTYALFGIAFICLVALVLAILSWRASRRHAQQMSEGRAQLQSIIDNVEEGLVRIGPELILSPQVSSHFLRITGGQDFKGKKLHDLFAIMDLDSDRIATAIQSVDATIGEDALAWGMNEHNLPVLANIHGREIALYWQAEISGDTVTSLLLVLRDVTEINELHRQTARAQETADRLLIFAREIIACNPRSIRKFMAELPQLLAQWSEFTAQENASELKKLAHMIKGTARALGLIALQNAMHEFEDRLKMEPPAVWKTSLNAIEELIQNYRSAAEHVLGHGEASGAQTLFDHLALLKPGLEKQLQQAGITLGSFSVKEDVALSAFDLDQLREVILHGLTNAADHGFILPKQQGRTDTTTASFQLEITAEAGAKVLTLRDNGAGINHQKIRELAAKRGWQPPEGKIWSDFLFEEGVSTAENLSLTSGRGVGLAAIYSAAQQLGGTVKLLDNDAGRGSMIRLVWPLEQSAAA